MKKTLLFFAITLGTANLYCGGFAGLVGPVPQEIKDLITQVNSRVASSNVTRDKSQFIYPHMLIIGQPGSGKTSLAEALSEELTCPFYYKLSSDLSSAKNIKKTFDDIDAQISQRANPCAVLFIDDFDTFGSAGAGGIPQATVDTREHVLALASQLDGFEGGFRHIIVIGASRQDKFDEALLRPGRLSLKIELELPNKENRVQLIIQFAESYKIQSSSLWQKITGGNATIDKIGIDLDFVAGLCSNFTPADMKELVDIAFLQAQQKNSTISQGHFLISMMAVLKGKKTFDQDIVLKISMINQILTRGSGATPKIGFARLAGEVPTEIKNLVQQIKDPSPFIKMGREVPKGFLFAGPPGTGKTTLARAVAEEAGCEFISATGTEFIQGLVGAGAGKVRDLFAKARLRAKYADLRKTIVFIDEIDVVGNRQNKQGSGAIDESVVNQLLTELDGFSDDDSVIVIAATNHPKKLDSALLRPGRLSHIITVGLPDKDKRALILQSYASKTPLAADVDLDKLAQVTNNFSPADLKELIQRGAEKALDEGTSKVTLQHCIAALKSLIVEKGTKGEISNPQLQLNGVDVLFNGKDSVHGFQQIAGGVPQDIADLVAIVRGDLDYSAMGIPCPKGFLFTGPPGTGKTALARALAEEAGCEFIATSGSYFVEKFVGVGAQRVRDTFAQARQLAAGNQYGKTILFIDEIDAIGSRSQDQGMGGASEANRTITALLTEMDGVDGDESVIVIAATNNPSLLDTALTRPGRLDTIIEIGLPDQAKRHAILAMYCKGKPLADSVSLNNIAMGTAGFSAADLKDLVIRAAKGAVRKRQKTMTQADFDTALVAMQREKTVAQQSFI